MEKKSTPMMEQYWQAKNSLPKDAILLFRLGDFYEMFYDDAVEGARILGIALTKRQDYPMAGIPYHAAQQYLPKLLAAGKKIAICEQDEIPQPGKLVKRSISKIITPGTVLEAEHLDSRHSNFLAAIDIDSKHRLYAAWIDVSAGEFYCAEFDNPSDFFPIFSACNPREILLPESASQDWKNDRSLFGWNTVFRSLADLRPVTLLHDYRFEPRSGAELLRDLLKVSSLDGFGIPSDSRLSGPAGALVFYVTENLRGKPGNIRTIRRFSSGKSVLIDPATQRSLEIFASTSGTREGSLLHAMDATKTSAGARLLESYLAAPVRDIEEISRRQNLVWEFYMSPTESARLSESLSQVRDIKRIMGRLQNRVKSPRDLGAILSTLEQVEPIRSSLLSINSSACAETAGKIPDFSELRGFLRSALADELPAKAQDGGMIRPGFDAELDKLRSMSHDNIAWLADLEKQEQARTGIKNLRVKYNGAFGYFIEVTKSNLSLVPPEYIRRQTMTNAERFTTEELRRKEGEILHADENARAMEFAIFEKCVDYTLQFSEALDTAAAILSEIDVFRGWAEIARERDYCKPEVDDGDSISVKDGRHPVVEQMLRRDRLGLARSDSFVPNDIFISSSEEQIALITGPNMAGKSTYIRQVALTAIMAQVGSFVPARKCRIGIVDRIFSRVGASDDLSRGNSTFMVEMNETANILNNATDKSLIILDEIGRGTSTYDGLSIAWAVVEFIHGSGRAGPKTLFATHYHEITQLEKFLPRLVNYRVCVKEWNDEIIFVRRIERGATDKSYGIQVARLAGLPQKVIERAKEVLSELENEGGEMAGNLGGRKKARKITPRNDFDDGCGESNFRQLSLF